MAQQVGVTRGKAEQVGRARDVAVEDVEPDQHVLQLGHDRGGELREALGGDDGGETALAAARAQVGQGGDAEPAGIGIERGTGDMRCEQMALVDAHQHGMRPVLARCADQAGKERGCLDDPLVGIEVGEVDVHRQPMSPAARRRGRQPVGGEFDRADRGRADMAGEVLEFPLGVDDRKRRIVERLLDDPAQGPALARPGAALDEQASGKQAIEVEAERAGRMMAERYAIVRGLGRANRGDTGHGVVLRVRRRRHQGAPDRWLGWRERRDRERAHHRASAIRACRRFRARSPGRWWNRRC